MIVFGAVNLIAAGSVFAGNVADEEISDAVEIQVKQADLAQKQAELVQKQAVNSSRRSDPVISLRRSLLLGSRSGSTGTVLVIPLAEIKAEEIIAVTEDMNVMARIFEKNLQQAHIATARGGLFLSGDYVFGTLLGRGRGAMQSMYLQGYGALFLMKVDFPLSPPPQVEQEKETKQEEDTDPVWMEMKQEMFEPEESRRRRTDRSEQKKYDAEKVENLKTTLVKALKHAANIRSLKPDESVVLTITGSGQSAGDAMIVTTKAIVVNGENTRIVKESVPGGAGFTSHTVLVIRTKKSDIDSFAKGDLDFDQFRQRTQMFTYPLLGGAAERGGPFDLYIR